MTFDKEMALDENVSSDKLWTISMSSMNLNYTTNIMFQL